MKIVSPAEMSAADSACELPARVLMESAGREVARFLVARFYDLTCQGVVVFCGKGNNGGDGYVVARALRQAGMPVAVYGDQGGSQQGAEQRTREEFLHSGGQVYSWGEALGTQRSGKLIVDCIFGTGFKGAAKGQAVEVIDFINSLSERDASTVVVSVDIPSGVCGETGDVAGSAVRASCTICLQCLKRGCVLFPGAKYCGEVYVADIGIPAQQKEIEAVSVELITETLVQSLLQKNYVRPETSHKGSRGSVLVIGGSSGYWGAGKIAGLAALRTGAGLVSLVLHGEDAGKVAAELFELTSVVLPELNAKALQSLESKIETFDAVVLGPGLGQESAAVQLVETTLEVTKRYKKPVVVDADAINILSLQTKSRQLLHSDCILTPHPGEMMRFTGLNVNDIEAKRIQVATKVSFECGCPVLLKGARTVIASPAGTVAINPWATSALSTAGSGDVLAGMLAVFLARGLSVFDAARAGSFIHGASGKYLENNQGGPEGVISGDLLAVLPLLINLIMHRRHRQKRECFLQQVFPVPFQFV